mmetsp:Transcript_1829/g.4733  ORF Transcript_1829/g.4733 Transcript_1829/m.4733 type:complete len:475 (+) Transcript_1829:80-1504(+)
MLARSALFLAMAISATPCSGQLMRREASSRKGPSTLQAVLQELLGGVPSQRLFAIEASVRPTYEAFPKNAMGQIPSQEIFAAIVRAYFLKEHGWLLKGLEPPSMVPAVTTVPQSDVLREKAPKLAEALERLLAADRGLSISDVVGTIAALEHLLLEESTALLRSAYALNERSVEERLDKEGLHEVLRSYLLLFRQGMPRNLTDVSLHQRMKARARNVEDWKELLKFEAESVALDGRESDLSFEEAAKIASEMTLRFGKWQNSECVQMKDNLMALGSTSSGRVPLEVFHAERKHASYQFTESAEYLQRSGALDEAEDGTKQVLVANYLLGRSNCIASSEYYSVCCLSECEALTSELEQKVQAPAWPAPRLLSLVGQTPSSSVSAPRELPAALTQDLEAIAARHDGLVPLHSADFKHFLHGAFPNECPLPTATESVAEETERTAAIDWLARQEECTRLPDWHPANWEEEEATLVRV